MDPGAMARCSQLGRVAGEPLAGTAPHAARWLCLEHPGPWGRDVSEDPDADVAELARRAADAGWRLELIRRPGRGERALPSRTVLLVDTAVRAPRLTWIEVASPAELLTVDLAGIADGDRRWPGTPVEDPQLLICTHGRRDRCCALEGRVLAGALEHTQPGVWECSHLGGHRFAPTGVVLPTGYVYGRLDPTSAAAARKAASMGEMESAHCRGRATWSPSGQVAELAIRELTGERDAAVLTAFDDVQGDLVPVRHTDGRVWGVHVAAVPMGATRPLSCGAELLPLVPLVATAIDRLA